MLVRGKEDTLPNICTSMFSVPDIAVVAVLALLLFGPDKLPGMMRTAGRFMREVQNTSHSFVAEMERAADVNDRRPTPAPTPSPVEGFAESKKDGP